MFVKRQCTIKSDSENFDVRGDGNSAAGCIDTGNRRKSVRLSPSVEDKDIGLV